MRDNAVYKKPLVIVAARIHEVLEQKLQLEGCEVVHLSQFTNAAMEPYLPLATGIVFASGIAINETLLQQAPLLRWVGRLGSGMELVDMEAAEKRNIAVYNSPEGNCLAVGEHALGMLLNLLHKISISYESIKEGKWIRDANRGTELSGKTVGIIGYGHTGRAFAKLLMGFQVKVLAHDKYKTGFSQDHVSEASLQNVLDESDVISLHLPLTDETYHYAGMSFFQQLKGHPIFINTSRGEVHDTNALSYALESNLISGAALDVLENESLSSYTVEEQQQLQFLMQQKNVLITPHIAGYSHEASYKMSHFLAKKIRF
ncbi:MAG: hydroxyacid dehydrogenase [Bacteroidetes bacterium]|nr:hydroxyacid dehydrogenase [Bacteroidota bacterium]